ncbi:hypothetical protein MMC13_003941 [Lambiella insularis]|nr:hypothetical protein [Lambiella insularis]
MSSPPPVPDPLPTPANLTLPNLQSLLALYDLTLAHLASTKRKPKNGQPALQELDELRYETFPARVQARRTDATASAAHGWLEKEELEQLMVWKITRGTFRPTLPALIRSNAVDTVKKTTADGFSLYASSPPDPSAALKKLAELKGVGPATASLLLAVAYPGVVPFFADELLVWLRREGGGGKGEKLKYDWKEYKEVREGVEAVRARLGGVSAVDVERGVWVAEVLRDEGVRENVLGEGGVVGSADGTGVENAGSGNGEAEPREADTKATNGGKGSVNGRRRKRKGTYEDEKQAEPVKKAKKRAKDAGNIKKAIATGANAVPVMGRMIPMSQVERAAAQAQEVYNKRDTRDEWRNQEFETALHDANQVEHTHPSTSRSRFLLLIDHISCFVPQVYLRSVIRWLIAPNEESREERFITQRVQRLTESGVARTVVARKKPTPGHQVNTLTPPRSPVVKRVRRVADGYTERSETLASHKIHAADCTSGCLHSVVHDRNSTPIILGDLEGKKLQWQKANRPW